MLGAKWLSKLDERRLKVLLGVFFLALAVPAAVLIAQAYGQLKWEAFRRNQLLAEDLARASRLRFARGRRDRRGAFVRRLFVPRRRGQGRGREFRAALAAVGIPGRGRGARHARLFPSRRARQSHDAALARAERRRRDVRDRGGRAERAPCVVRVAERGARREPARAAPRRCAGRRWRAGARRAIVRAHRVAAARSSAPVVRASGRRVRADPIAADRRRRRLPPRRARRAERSLRRGRFHPRRRQEAQGADRECGSDAGRVRSARAEPRR